MTVFEMLCDKQTVAKNDAIEALRKHYGRLPDNVKFVGDAMIYIYGSLEFAFFQMQIDRCPCVRLIQAKNTYNGQIVY